MNARIFTTLLAELRWLARACHSAGIPFEVALSFYEPNPNVAGIQVHFGENVTLNIDVTLAAGAKLAEARAGLIPFFNREGLSTSYSWNSAEFTPPYVQRLGRVNEMFKKHRRGIMGLHPSLSPHWDGHTKQWFELKPVSAVKP